MSEVPELILKAKREMRQIQMTYGRKITPAISKFIGNAWERALVVDPKGSQLKYVIEETKELLKRGD